MDDQNLIYEAYLGAAGLGEGLGQPIHTKLHKASDYNVPEKECVCDHGNPCNCCDICNQSAVSEEDETLGDNCCIEQEFTDIAKQQLYNIHKISELLHELIDHHAFKPWMAQKISQAYNDLNSIHDRVDYEVAVNSNSNSDTDNLVVPDELKSI